MATPTLLRTIGERPRWFTGPDLWSLAFDSGAKTFLAANRDALRLWSIEGELLRTFSGAAGGRGERVAFALDDRVAIGRLGDDVCKWNARTGEVEGLLSAAGAILATDGRRALCRGLSRVVLWDLETASPLFELETSAAVENAAMTPDGRRAVLGAGALELWDLESGALVRRIERNRPEDREMGPVAISTDGDFAFGLQAAGWRHGWPTVWNVDGAVVTTSDAGGEQITLAAFLDGRRLITAIQPAGLLKWNEKGIAARVFGFDEGRLTALDVSRDARTMIVGDRHGDLAVYDLTLRKRVDGRVTDSVTAVVSDDRVYFSRAASLGSWHLDTGDELAIEDAAPVIAMQPTSDGVVALHAAGPKDAVCIRWQRTMHLGGFDVGVPAALCSTRVASATGAFIQLLDLDGNHLRTIEAPAPPTWLLLTERGIAAGSSGQLDLWDTEDGRLVKHLSLHDSSFHAISPDSRWLCASQRGHLYDLTEAAPYQPWFSEADTAIRAFSPDSRVLALASLGGRWGSARRSVMFWDLARRERIATLDEAHEAAVISLAFDATGHRLVTAGADGTFRVWDLRSIL